MNNRKKTTPKDFFKAESPANFYGSRFISLDLRRYPAAVLAMVLFVMMIPVAPAVAQVPENSGTLHLTLDQALEIASGDNYANRIAGREVEITRSRFRQTNRLFLPQLTLEETVISTNNPLNVFGSLLRQEVVSAADFNPAFLNDPDPVENYTTSVNVRQPLLNPDGFLKRGAMKDRLNASKEQQNRTRYFVDFKVKQQYYALVLAGRKIEIVNTALRAATANLDQAKEFFEQGLINKADLLAAEVRVKQLKSEQSAANNDRINTENELGYLLGLENIRKIVPVDDLAMKTVAGSGLDYDRALASRSDMVALQYRIEASRKNLNASRFSFTPSVNLFGSYEWNDDSFLGTRASSYTIGATLKWNIFSGFENVGAVQASKAELEKAKLQYRDRLTKNRMEIDRTLRSLEDARLRVELARSAVEQADESYRIRFNRYKQGLEKITDLLGAEATLAEARLQEAGAIYRYNLLAMQLELMLERDVVEE